MPLLFLVMDDAASAQCDNIGSVYDASNESTPGLKGLLEQRHSVRNYGEMPINVYAVISRVEGIDAGLYYFSPGKDSLAQVFCRRPEVERGDLYVFEFSQYAPVNLILTGDIRRFFWKYDCRGYRLMNVDCGIFAENICLLAQEQGIGLCMLTAFYGQAVGRVLQLNAEELPLLCLSLGDQDI